MHLCRKFLSTLCHGLFLSVYTVTDRNCFSGQNSSYMSGVTFWGNYFLFLLLTFDLNHISVQLCSKTTSQQTGAYWLLKGEQHDSDSDLQIRDQQFTLTLNDHGHHGDWFNSTLVRQLCRLVMDCSYMQTKKNNQQAKVQLLLEHVGFRRLHKDSPNMQQLCGRYRD